jgi:hypothetical protein
VNIRDDRFEGLADSIALAGVGVEGRDNDTGFGHVLYPKAPPRP